MQNNKNPNPKDVAALIKTQSELQNQAKQQFAAFFDRGSWSFNGLDGVHRGLSEAIIHVKMANGQYEVRINSGNASVERVTACFSTAKQVLEYIDEIEQALSP